jgi:hypothetical protein
MHVLVGNKPDGGGRTVMSDLDSMLWGPQQGTRGLLEGQEKHPGRPCRGPS